MRTSGLTSGRTSLLSLGGGRSGWQCSTCEPGGRRRTEKSDWIRNGGLLFRCQACTDLRTACDTRIVRRTVGIVRSCDGGRLLDLRTDRPIVSPIGHRSRPCLLLPPLQQKSRELGSSCLAPACVVPGLPKRFYVWISRRILPVHDLGRIGTVLWRGSLVRMATAGEPNARTKPALPYRSLGLRTTTWSQADKHSPGQHRRSAC
jgi:hypothetical protein